MNYTIDKKDYGIKVNLTDSLTFRDHDTFFEIVKYIKTNKPHVVVLNMKDCDFIDSAGLGMCVILSDEVGFINGTVAIVNPVGKVRAVMYAARFNSLFRMLPEKDADKSLTDNKINQFVVNNFKWPLPRNIK